MFPRRFRRVLRTASFLFAVGAATLAKGADGEFFAGGLPFTRYYPLEEIGNVSRGASVTFDSLGRTVVVYRGTYAVLNDFSWIDMMEKESRGDAFLKVVADREGVSYYGALGSWGVLEQTERGLLRPRSFRRGTCPEWVSSTNFTSILPRREEVYFGGWSGLIRWERATGVCTFMEVQGLVSVFEHAGQVYVSSVGGGLLRLRNGADGFEKVSVGRFRPFRVSQAEALGDGRVLLLNQNHALFVFDGLDLHEWRTELEEEARQNVSAVRCLPDGNVAVAVEGRGVFILTKTGSVLRSLTTPEYRYVHQLASRSPGVLWIVTDRSLGKVYYGSPLTIVDQQLGLSVKWPIVARSMGKLYVLSMGRLFESAPGREPSLPTFRPVEGLPPEGAWALAGHGEHLLIGNDSGVYSLQPSGRFEHILSGTKASRLIMTDDDLCYVVGDPLIAVMRFRDGRWRECAPRVPGVGFSQVGQAIGRAAWVELGVNKAARVALEGDRIVTRVFDSFPWSETAWINIGFVGKVVVLTGAEGKRIYFDEEKGEFCEAPEAMKMLEAFPSWITRMSQDRSGTIWASHEKGVTCFFQNSAGGWEYNSLPLARDQFPVIQLVDDDVWFSNEFALYHVDGRRATVPPPPTAPVLASINDARTDSELFSAPGWSGPWHFPHSQNSLRFRFFAGDWPGMREPKYAYRMNGKSSWSILDGESLLTLADLREGSYRLEVRIADALHSAEQPLTLAFSVEPPWYRAWYAYFLYSLTVALGLWGVASFLLRRARSRNLALERLVQARTEELRLTMVKLNEETKTKATLAERDRLAGEIHDSVQQGLSGLMLQLDATLKLPEIPNNVRSRLAVARSMASFSRQEVQYALKDMESPFLESGDLGAALDKMAEFITAGSEKPKIELKISGEVRALPSEVKHHLLRIGQEAMSNAIRHGMAEHVELFLEYEPDEVVFTVKDDGRGFQPQTAMSLGPGHFGLRGLKTRAAKIGGALKIASDPGKGTEICVRVPLNGNPHLSNYAVRQ